MGRLGRVGRHDKAVYWKRTGVDQDNRPTVDQPIEIDCRWVDKARQMVSRDGTIIGVESTVFTDEPLEDGSVLWHGELEDRPGTGFGDEREQLMEVISVDKVPSIRGRETIYRANLQRYTDERPSLT